jgi:endoglucanase
MHTHHLHIRILLLAACAAAVSPCTAAWVPRIGAVATDVLAVTVEDGGMTRARPQPYVPRPGDRVDRDGHDRWLTRDGHVVGTLVGADAGTLFPFDVAAEPALDAARLDSPAAWRVRALRGAGATNAVAPAAVYRKSRPTAMARTGTWAWVLPVRHTFYLVLPAGLATGTVYCVEAADGSIAATSYTHDPATSASDAVHVSQVGFHPGDPCKLAFLSCWMGSGGGLGYAEGTPFALIDEARDMVVFRGRATLRTAASAPEDPYRRNYNGTDVYQLDFSDWSRPGRYRIAVDGIGCSAPFSIAADAWRRAFTVAARGFYHQRSGTALGPPFTTFARPRSFHPDDGVRVFASTCPLYHSGNGLNALGTDTSNFGNLVAGATDTLVPDAWGGYFDAGDWDRRIQHLDATRLLLELVELFPIFADAAALNLPESGNALPDLLDEALWNVAFFRRLQTPDGGIRGGVESEEHPRRGEGSWQESLRVMAYAPDPWCSYLYAGVAARAAACLRRHDLAAASALERSARRAMSYAETNRAGVPPQPSPHAVSDARNLAAAELLRLTGEPHWRALFLETTVFTNAAADVFWWQHHDQRDAAFLAARALTNALPDDVVENARRALLREADIAVDLGRGAGFGWTKSNPWQPHGFGSLSTPAVTTILRAHALTGDARYLASAVLASQTGAGANPLNLCYTTGVGRDWPRHVLWHDAQALGAEAPPGLTVYGPMDAQRDPDYWCLKVLAPAIHPGIRQWPVMETFFDVFLFPAMSEFTVMQTLGPNTYAWGYLAAAPRHGTFVAK